MTKKMLLFTRNQRVAAMSAALACAIAYTLPGGNAAAQPSRATNGTAGKLSARAVAPDSATRPPPFAANLFLGNFKQQHKDGRSPNYSVMPGDRVAVNTWGSVQINKVFVVDAQGNIFLPGIGPIRLAGVKTRALTGRVKARIAKVYRRFGVYTNLLTAAPVGVFVTGGVARPGRYAGVPSDSTLFFLDQAGGIDSELGSYRDIAILRGGKTVAQIDLYEFVLNGTLPTVQFADGDTVLVRRRGPVIELRGQVASAAMIEFSRLPMTGTEALRIIPSRARGTAVTLSGIRNGRPFHQTMSLREFQTMSLRDGDTIQLRDDGKAGSILIQLDGEFKGPALLSVHRGSRLLDVLNHVPVDLRVAHVGAVYIRRASVAAAQKKSIENSLLRLERSALLALSATDREAAIRVKEAQLMQNFVKAARLIQPLGRVVTSSTGRQLNLLLQDGDTIVIPARTNVVRVGGEVQMAQAVMYKPGLRARDYIRMAGGYTKRSDTGKVIVLHASAAVTVGGRGTHVVPGDEILVPPKVHSKLLQNAADVTQVLYQIAVAAAVIIAL